MTLLLLWLAAGLWVAYLFGAWLEFIRGREAEMQFAESASALAPGFAGWGNAEQARRCTRSARLPAHFPFAHVGCAFSITYVNGQTNHYLLLTAPWTDDPRAEWVSLS